MRKCIHASIPGLLRLCIKTINTVSSLSSHLCMFLFCLLLLSFNLWSIKPASWSKQMAIFSINANYHSHAVSKIHGVLYLEIISQYLGTFHGITYVYPLIRVFSSCSYYCHLLLFCISSINPNFMPLVMLGSS